MLIKCMVIVGLYCVSTVIPHTTGVYSWYSTIGELRNLTLQDERMLEDLEKRMTKGKAIIKQLLLKIEFLKNVTLRHLRKYAMPLPETEINVCTNLFKDETKLLQQVSTFPINDTVLKIYTTMTNSFPGMKDMKVVLQTLHNLQNSYDLKTEELSRGYVMGKFSGKQLSANACFRLAQLSCDSDSFERCRSWVNEALKKVDDKMTRYDAKEVEGLVHLASMKKEFSRLCAASVNSSYVEDAANKNLKCYLWDNSGHPLLRLQPVRTEVMSKSPNIVLFYNVISDKEIAHIKQKAFHLLGKATTVMREKTIRLNSYRIAHNCWLSKQNDSIIKKLDGFVEAITGLNARKSLELLQVANYGIGGQYGVHMDPMEFDTPEIEIRRKNRKATFMFYLSDVRNGGATAFTHSKVAIKPVKGAAVFWNNLESTTGMPDNRTLHGSCPVLLGNKWVANKWIWETKREICMSKNQATLIH